MNKNVFKWGCFLSIACCITALICGICYLVRLSDLAEVLKGLDVELISFSTFFYVLILPVLSTLFLSILFGALLQIDDSVGYLKKSCLAKAENESLNKKISELQIKINNLERKTDSTQAPVKAPEESSNELKDKLDMIIKMIGKNEKPTIEK